VLVFKIPVNSCLGRANVYCQFFKRKGFKAILQRQCYLLAPTAIPSNSKVIIDCTHSKSIAYDVAEYVENYRRSAKLKNIAVQTVAFVPILKGMIEAGEIEIIGGNHNISMGEVIFYTNTLLINNPK
jgi:hypothetical protein